MSRYLILSICLAGLVFLTDCKTKDTCNSVLGDTFQMIELDTMTVDNSANISIVFDWSTLEELPDSYFADASLLKGERDRFNNEWINDHDDLLSWQADKSSYTLTLKADALPSIGNEKEFNLHFRFPDRADHIDCTHPGSGDAYYFDISFLLVQNNSGVFELSNLKWVEAFRPGGG